MQKLIIMGMTVALAFTTLADETQQKPKLTPEQRRAKIMAHKMRLTGGSIEKPGTGSGKVAYINLQKKIPPSAFAFAKKQLGELLNIRLEFIEGKNPVTVADAGTAFKEYGVKGAIYIVDDSTLPTVLVAPEANWAMINAAALSADKPSEDVLSKRASREAWRTFAMLFGAADSSMKGCVLKPVSSLSDLDLIGECVCPEPMSKIVEHLKSIGVDPVYVTTYLHACQQGWAPAPTNEYQKAIWDKVHSLPTKPIKIEYDKAKGR